MSRPTDNTAHARIQWEIEQGIVAPFLFPAQLIGVVWQMALYLIQEYVFEVFSCMTRENFCQNIRYSMKYK